MYAICISSLLFYCNLFLQVPDATCHNFYLVRFASRNDEDFGSRVWQSRNQECFLLAYVDRVSFTPELVRRIFKALYQYSKTKESNGGMFQKQ